MNISSSSEKSVAHKPSQSASSLEYVLLGHIAKFVQPGGRRIETPGTRGQGISQVAFKNPDGTIVLIAFNHNSEKTTIQVDHNQNSFQYQMAAGMLTTFLIED